MSRTIYRGFHIVYEPKHVWHGRDEADRYCWSCRFPDRE